MMHGFEYDVNTDIPVLAWCAVIDSSGKCRVTCGADVEINENYFVEGAWNGQYSEMKFEEAEFLCGSGGKVTRGGVFVCNSQPCIRENRCDS